MYNIFDEWDNTDCADIDTNQSSPPPSTERLRLLAERKLIEEADIALTHDLFSIPQTIIERNTEADIKGIKIAGKQPIRTKPNKKVYKNLKQMAATHKLTGGSRAGL
jgi:hypothetical protein